ncbi:thioredoxin reductase GliT [Talaromyces stipitatus ATCC 10500]|uniref:Thioredoxin reductase GliT n=1 Tax=Talaromyces stipitatus (strain ATCC 10500 / CBS 375.48 / QM 6759 / NRRL 1006) TaxID=441959 RepID=B8MIF9_TALSN|nr:thioredoxin reductase GliT [Talaromyces stipitatus ATCC 10500]EED14643.1 thioredoxin reductase GliT [Talaromyces stipitatus ATCC 10500]
MLSPTLYDALIIGAGPAGLSVATGLARQLHTAAVFSSSVFRNAKVKHMHNVLGWDHRSPTDFRAKARADLLARYSTVQFYDEVEIESVSRQSDGRFEARDVRGDVWRGKKLVLAMGVKDIFPDIEGYEDCWGETIHHCLFCDGYEKRGAPSAGVLATDVLETNQRAMHVNRMARRLVDKVTIYTNGNNEQASTFREAIAALDGFKVDPRPFMKLEKKREMDGNEPKIIIHFKDGTCAEEAFLAHGPRYVLNGPFAQQLSLETVETGELKVSPMFNETSMPGVFAVGDCATPMKAVTPAIAMGTGTAAAIVMQLQEEKQV